ncbi:MAG: hypothetical protein U9P00_03590, partial [Pseudomonadota bacterium]|nr:hypothetical protein [Pseudomonadota bacterium]
NVGRVFDDSDICLQNAKISTFGSQAEDVFYVAGGDDRPLSEEKQGELRQALIHTLDASD